MLTARRYRARKAAELAEAGQTAVAAAFRAKAEATPATPLPADFPGRDKLEAATPMPYTTYEDLNGANADELVAIDGIGRKTAERILAAVETWASAQAPA